MAERKRSNDGTRETDRFTEGPATPGHQGRDGEGPLPRDIGTRDEKRQAEEGDAGVTRVRKSDEREGTRPDTGSGMGSGTGKRG